MLSRPWLAPWAGLFMMLAANANKLDGCNGCILGVNADGYLVYSYALLCQKHMDDGMPMMEAVEFVDYNILGLGGRGVNWEIVFPLIDEIPE